MSTNYSTTNQSYKHLSEAERGEIEAYLSVGLKPITTTIMQMLLITVIVMLEKPAII